MNIKTISVIGLGYIGLPTAAMFASCKISVVGVDVNQTVVDTINQGRIHIAEPGLDLLVHNAVDQGYLRAVSTPEPADVFLIAVPTPFKLMSTKAGIPEPNLAYIEEATKSIAPLLREGNLVILESTSPVGSTEQIAEWLTEVRSDLTFPKTNQEKSDVRIAHCPERVLPGLALKELVENDRVIGGITPKCSQAAVELYKIFVKGECIVTNARTAEMAKLTENASRDVSIAFANELSVISDQLDINVWELISLANRHPRVNILQPGPGVGGHCIAVDPWFIVSKTPEAAKIIHTARQVNDAKPDWVVDRVKIAITDLLQSTPDKKVSEITVACYGLAFKPDIDDLRESPALNITKCIGEIHAGRVIAVEPNIRELPESVNDRVELVELAEANREADIVVVLVKHVEFAGLVVESLHASSVIDTCGLWGGVEK